MASDLPDYGIALTVRGQDITGFESGSVNLTMEDGFNSFDLEYVADENALGERPILEGDECSLAINAGSGMETLIEGYVDEIADDDDPTYVRLRCAGRSKTMDLYDASAITKPGSWKGQAIDKIAKQIAGEFDVNVVMDGDPGTPFAHFSVVKGETGFEAIQRGAARRGLHCFCVGKDLVIAEAGNKSSGATLERGKNVVRSSRVSSWRDRFSEYIYRGQVRGTDDASGAKASQNKARVTDATINRFRPKLLQSYGKAKDLERKAEVERNVRAGRSEVFTVLVDGWGTDEGKAWRPNTTVVFMNPVFRVNAKLLIVSVAYRFGPAIARETELRLMRKEAFDTANYPRMKPGSEIR